jgi:hypothetical protein
MMTEFSNRETQTIYQHLVEEPEALALAKRVVEGAADAEAAMVGLESYFGDHNIMASGLVGDLVSAAMARVDWAEIASAVSHDPT